MQTEKSDVYTRVTNKIVADLERGNLTWLQPWQAGHRAGPISRPLRTGGKAYRPPTPAAQPTAANPAPAYALHPVGPHPTGTMPPVIKPRIMTPKAQRRRAIKAHNRRLRARGIKQQPASEYLTGETD